MTQDLQLYCNCIAARPARHRQFIQRDIICNAASLDSRQRKLYQLQDYILDDSGENISDLNRYFGDLTGLYWVWKNTDHEYLGTNQYRRFWNDQAVNDLKLTKNTLYVYKIDLQENIVNQFSYFHGSTMLQILYEAARQNKIKITDQQVRSMENLNYIFGCNMFFCNRSLFDRLCALMFEMLFEIYEGSKYALPYIDHGRYQSSRLIAFLSERLMTVIVNNSQHFLGPIDIVPVDVRVI